MVFMTCHLRLSGLLSVLYLKCGRRLILESLCSLCFGVQPINGSWTQTVCVCGGGWMTKIKSKWEQYFMVCGNCTDLQSCYPTVQNFGAWTCSFVYILIMAESLLWWQIWVVETKIIRPTKMKIFLLSLERNVWWILNYLNVCLSLCSSIFSFLA